MVRLWKTPPDRATVRTPQRRAPERRQIGKPFRQSKVKPAGQIGDRNACPPQFQQVQKKGCRVKFQKAAPFLDGEGHGHCYR